MGIFDSFPKVFPHWFGFPWETPAKVVAPGVAPAPGLSTAAMQLYRQQISQAATQGALSALLPAIQAQHNSKQMSDAQYSELITLYNTRMTSLQPKQTLTIISPVEGQIFTSGQGVTLSATGSGLSQNNLPVQWYVRQLSSSQATPLPSNYWMANTPGQVVITAEVQDPKYGRIATSLRSVTVKAVNQPAPTQVTFQVGDRVFYQGVDYHVTRIYPPGYYSDTDYGYQIHLVDESNYYSFGFPLDLVVAGAKLRKS